MRTGVKKIRLLLSALCLILLTAELSCAAGSTAEAASKASSKTSSGKKKTSVKKGFVEEDGNYYYYVDGKRIKNKWKTIKDPKTGKKYRYFFGKERKAIVGKTAKIKGKLYLFNEKGRLVQRSKKTIVTVSGKRYYVDQNGRVATGWLLINGKLYLADNRGKFYLRRTRDGITFDHKTGVAKAGTAASLKLKTIAIVNSITTPKMSKSQKLLACWNYVTRSGGFFYSPIYPNLNQSGWQKSLALRMLSYKGGNCYGFACVFAALAREVGYSPRLVCGRVSGSRDGAADGLTRHCWVIINGCYYDPEAQWKGWMRGVYGSGGYPIRHTVQRIVTF